MAQPFPETHWSQLLMLRDHQHPRRRELLEGLAQRYWTPVYDYVRALRRLSADDAREQVQEFFAFLLSGERLDRLSPERGSFRGFLKTALRNFLTDSDRAARARQPTSSSAQAENIPRPQPGLDPEAAFDRAWSVAVLSEAVELLRDELRGAGRTAQLEMFESYCLQDGGDLTYQELGLRHGVSLDDVRNRLRESRQRLRQILRTLLRGYLGPDDDLEAELKAIVAR